MNDYGGQLAKTGLGAITIGGVTYALGGWLIGIAAALVVIGAITVRLGFRRSKDVAEK
ncbi:hypothetical protein SRB17_86850 [Streptomyces sp. RB17]|uniref:hypothetical protein n=1 Tax=Streptomyces sp. RB17 TaxID=2585197 RepID=UPI00129685EA|nr:hypothetical protein [Streptomyces sp. RB17]MQY40652.1 hypothetical protein [Streptomyces sp. RB17]